MKLIPKMLLGMGLMALPAFCGAISLDQWYVFGWNGNPTTDALNKGTSSGYVGSLGTSIAGLSCPGAAPCSDLTSPWTFTGAADITVQDLYYAGDRFSVFDFGSLVGTTSNPANDGTYCGNDPAACGSVKFSKGTFSLGSGAHSLTIQIIQETSAVNSGSAVFRLAAGSGGGEPGVPEPTTLSMMGLGLGALIFGWRARRKA